MSHHILIDRLNHIGICDNALKLIASFLTGRTHRIRLPPYTSDLKNIICGVPQESSLSPTLFNVYMIPLAHIVLCHGLNIISYADDTQLILSLTEDTATTRTNFMHAMTNVAD